MVFDRTFVTYDPLAGTSYLLGGEGSIWGFDLMLQKLDSRYVDGWITYSFNDVQYRDGGGWYHPEFHRFHTLNLVLNIKPTKGFHIGVHMGFASGKLAQVIESVTPTVVDGVTLYVPVYAADMERTGFSLPLDIKLTWYLHKPGSKLHTEIYLAVENVLGPLLPSTKTTVINPYTGAREEAGGMAVMTELAIPLPSFGVKWRY